MDNKLTEYILRHSKKRDRELKYDFMPSLLEIIERPAHKAGTIIILSIFTLLAAAIVWACLSEVDVVITANGSLQPNGNISIVKTYTSGTVKDVNVSEGAYVKKGEILYELDTAALDIDIESLEEKKQMYENRLEIYSQIKEDDESSNIDISKYDEAFQNEVQALIDAKESCNNSIAKLEKDKAAYEINKQIAKLQAEEYESEEKPRLAQTQELAIQQYDLAIEQLDIQIEDAESQFNAQINSQIAETSQQLSEIRSELEKYNFSKSYQQIKAPISGYVNTVSVKNVGEPITAAQELVTIVPDNKPIEMVCYVKNIDIAEVAIDTPAEIKLESYPYNKFGTIKGKVTYISATSFSSEQMGSVYLVKIKITDKSDEIMIRPGLTGMVEIKTGKRTIMDYFLEPIIKGFGDSLKEK